MVRSYTRRLSNKAEPLFLIKLQQDGKGYSTIKTVRGVLRPASQMAVDDGVIHKNPFGFEPANVVVNDSVTRVAMHWEHRFNHMVKRHNEIYRVQMPNITHHICRHTYCSNMAKSGMNPKTLLYLMGHSDIGVTVNTYTHLGLEDAAEELRRMQEMENARKEQQKLEKTEAPVSQHLFRAV